MEDHLAEGLVDNRSDEMDDNLYKGVGNNLSKPNPTIQLKGTSMWQKMEEYREILQNAIHHNTQLQAQNAEMMEANRENAESLVDWYNLKEIDL